jgi:hypothetical protein
LSPRRFSVVPHGLSYYDSRTRTSRLLIRTVSLGRVIAQSTATKKSTTKCPPRDFRRHLRRDTARTLSLPQFDSRTRLGKVATKSTPPREQNAGACDRMAAFRATARSP